MTEIDTIISEIKKLFAEDSSGHDAWHSLRVYRTALKIAETEQCDERLVAIAALLHDADDPKLFPGGGHENALGIMTRAGIDDATKKQIIGMIEQVSFKGTDSEVPDTIEGRIVQDADRLDAMGAVGIARTFAYGGAMGRSIHDPGMPPRTGLNRDEYINNQGTSINHFYEKLFTLKDMMNTGRAKEIAELRDQFMHDYMDEFMDEWAGI